MGAIRGAKRNSCGGQVMSSCWGATDLNFKTKADRVWMLVSRFLEDTFDDLSFGLILTPQQYINSTRGVSMSIHYLSLYTRLPCMCTGRGILFSALAQNLIDWSYAEAKVSHGHLMTLQNWGFSWNFQRCEKDWKGILIHLPLWLQNCRHVRIYKSSISGLIRLLFE